MRRELADLVFLMKVASGHTDCPDLLSSISLSVPVRQSRHHNTLYVPLVSTNYRQNTFFWRVSNNFNMICETLNLDLFTTSIDSAKSRYISNFFAG